MIRSEKQIYTFKKISPSILRDKKLKEDIETFDKSKKYTHGNVELVLTRDRKIVIKSKQGEKIYFYGVTFETLDNINECLKGIIKGIVASEND